MNCDMTFHPAARRRHLLSKAASSIVSFTVSLCALTAGAQHAHQDMHWGRGATSAQDLAKMAAPAATGSDAADAVCARYTAGSVVAAPPELASVNGVLEVT